MIELYKPLEIPNLESIQQQLLSCVDEKYLTSTESCAFNYGVDVFAEKFPELAAWLISKSKVDIIHYRFYITPPGARLAPHIDQVGEKPIIPFRLSIPISGTKGTKLTFYSSTKDIRENSSFVPDGYLGSKYQIDHRTAKPIDSLELVTPHFINTSVIHGIRNTTQLYRIALSVTWKYTVDEYRNVEDVFNI